MDIFIKKKEPSKHGQYRVYSLILTFHFKPGSYFCQLNVLVVCFFIGVMSEMKIKEYLLAMFTTNYEWYFHP